MEALDIEEGECVARRGRLLAFLAGELARKDLRQCTRIDLFYAAGGDFKDDVLRAWTREDAPALFDSFADVDEIVSQVLVTVRDEVERLPIGRHRFSVRTTQHGGNRATMSFAIASRGSSAADGMSGAESTSTTDVSAATLKSVLDIVTDLRNQVRLLRGALRAKPPQRSKKQTKRRAARKRGALLR